MVHSLQILLTSLRVYLYLLPPAAEANEQCHFDKSQKNEDAPLVPKVL